MEKGKLICIKVIFFSQKPTKSIEKIYAFGEEEETEKVLWLKNSD